MKNCLDTYLKLLPMSSSFIMMSYAEDHVTCGIIHCSTGGLSLVTGLTVDSGTALNSSVYINKYTLIVQIYS